MNDIQNRLEYYADTYDIEKCKKENFDYLELYSDLLKYIENSDNDFFISKLKKICDCENITECDCDSDNSLEIDVVTDIHSNCKASLGLTIKEDKIINKKDIRMFYLSKDDEENIIFDINKKSISFFKKNKKYITFDIDKMTIMNNTISIFFDYMTFK